MQTYLKVSVVPSSKKEEVIEKQPDSLEVRVRAQAQRGLANEACLQAIARHLGCTPEELHICKGIHSKHKIILWVRPGGP